MSLIDWVPALPPAPLPQLLPDLNERLHLLRGREPVVDQLAIAVSSFIEPPDRVETQVGQVVTQILRVLFRKYLGLLRIWTPGHHGWCNVYEGSEPLFRDLVIELRRRELAL
jgi:hypothetical protein